jgi:hypothetical protein
MSESPSSFQKAARLWFARAFARTCSCEGLDVRIERGRVECGKCGSLITSIVMQPCPAPR